MLMKSLRIFVSLFVFISVSGCGTVSPKKISTQQQYEKAFGLYKDKSYFRAIPQFEEIIRKDPLNSYAVLSELHLADMLYEKEDFDEAILHYEEYLRLNPKAAEYEEVLYKIGMCHFNLIRTYDRDQTETKLAYEKNKAYLESFPSGSHREEVVRNIEAILQIKLMSEHNVGMFYYNSERYNSAVIRFENIINKYKKGDLLEESYLILAKSLDKLNKEDKLKNVFADYKDNFPNGRYKDVIRSLIEDKS